MTDNSSIDLSLTNIWKAWTNFRRGKKPSRAITIFESRLERNLLELCKDLNNGDYVHGLYDHKIVSEKKRRDIAVAQVRDRVVHRLLYDYLVPIVDKRLDFDVWSCRKGKGLHAGLTRTQQMISKYPNKWVWRADIEKFFDHVDHQVLKECLARLIDDTTVLKLFDKVIDSYVAIHSQSGIPIGNLTSQIFANIYLNEFDRFVRCSLKPLAYIRYGDDFVLFMADRQAALHAQDIATPWLFNSLHLKVHSKNNRIFRAHHGLYFLGHKIYPNSSITVDKAMLKKIKQDINVYNVSSYGAMHLPRKHKKQVPWLIMNH